MTSDVVVTMAHVRGAKLCARGARAWFKANNLSFQVFSTEGYPASVLEATGDHFAKQVCDVARGATGHG